MGQWLWCIFSARLGVCVAGLCNPGMPGRVLPEYDQTDQVRYLGTPDTPERIPYLVRSVPEYDQTNQVRYLGTPDTPERIPYLVRSKPLKRTWHAAIDSIFRVPPLRLKIVTIFSDASLKKYHVTALNCQERFPTAAAALGRALSARMLNPLERVVTPTLGLTKNLDGLARALANQPLAEEGQEEEEKEEFKGALMAVDHINRVAWHYFVHNWPYDGETVMLEVCAYARAFAGVRVVRACVLTDECLGVFGGLAVWLFGCFVYFSVVGSFVIRLFHCLAVWMLTLFGCLGSWLLHSDRFWIRG